MKNIPVKIDKIYLSLLIISIIFVLISIFLENILLGVVWIFAFTILFISTYSLRYFIENKKLVIKYFFMKKEVDIEKITKVRNFEEKFTKDFNYSLSFSGKIKIFYENNEKFLIISPKNKQEFLEVLADLNDDIDLDL